MKLPDMRVQRLSYTGTRKGMTQQQMREVLAIFKLSESRGPAVRKIFHHGGAPGGDRQAHRISQAPTIKARVYVHPAKGADPIDWYKLGAEHVYDPQPPLVRNPDIVEGGELLVATPFEMEEILRSGTWATIRYARKIGKPYVIIRPDGSFAQ